VLPVAVEESDVRRVGRKQPRQSIPDRAALSGILREPQDLGAGVLCARGGPVGGPVVDDEDKFEMAERPSSDGADGLVSLVGGNETRRSKALQNDRAYREST